MKFEVYCDESRPDLLCSQHPTARYMAIGGLWLTAESRIRMKHDIHALRNKHRIGGEFKWQKVSPSRLDFYRDLADWFVTMGDRLRFRCIAVEHEKVDLLHFHGQDQNAELRLGWDNKKKRPENDRRVAIVVGNYVVIIRIYRSIRAEFVTAFVAGQRTINQIRTNPLWT